MAQKKQKKPFFKLPGKPLPKRLLRPFVYEEPVSLDDKRLVILGLGDRVEAIQGFMILPYVIALGGGVGWFATGFREPIALIVAIVALAIALLMHYASKRMKHNQFTVFDREKGTVSFAKGLFSSGLLEGPWEDWSARLWIQSTSVGAAQHTLSIVHLPTSKMGMLTASITGVDHALGYWSFLVQYMDKDAPLPDVVDLKKYPNRTKGLGTWQEWKNGTSKAGRLDPYYEWLAELKEDSSLDVVNAKIEAKRFF
ncbi:MAG: hypothetical protein KZQ93_05210 [Candidatus Thiodiazotropha sp. (ex Monitilora ramsayi)]|nr:hypothetical protein [Candidatus Thiodiazotropha sp. (ex Monitilora ramsayi)]